MGAGTGPTVIAYVGVGANLGDARASVVEAMQSLAQTPGVQQLWPSSLYGSKPVDATGPDYVNAVARIRTTLTAFELLEALQDLEQRAGRTRLYHNAPRTLDLDILLYGDAVLNEPTLLVPHPRMRERAFVLQPLAELAPELVSPAQLERLAGQGVWRLD